jgi:septal ring factor EnvC (AmiA/AmiB activator)
MRDYRSHTGRRRSFIMGRALLAFIAVISLLIPVSAVHAGFIDRAKNIYQLPDEFNKMQQEYENTKKQLDEQKQKLTEAMQNSKAAQEQLIAQNRRLEEQNKILQQRIQAMEKVASDKEKRNRTIIFLISAAILLIVLYFISGRLFRVVVWRRQRKKFR